MVKCDCTVDRYTDYGGSYGGGYGGGRQYGGAGNFQLGSKRKSDLGEYGGTPKKLFGGTPRGNEIVTLLNPLEISSTCSTLSLVYWNLATSILYVCFI